MGLGDKIKQTLAGEHSPAAERGEVDSRTPGSFPTDEVSSGNPHTRGGMEQSSAGDKPRTLATDFGGLTDDPRATSGSSGPNKLHKSEDPRGWSPTDYEAAHGYTTSPSSKHGATDSGVGLKDYNYNDQSLGSGSHGLSHKKDHENLDHNEPYKEGYQYSKTHPSAADYSAFGAAGTGAGLAAGQLGQGQQPEQRAAGTEDSDTRNRVNSGRGKSSYEREDPYWGSLPQGSGTYNTVIGRGSEEETSGVHRQTPQTGDALYSDRGISDTEGLTQGAGTYNTVRGHGSQTDTGAPYDQTQAAGQQRSFPLRSGQGSARQDDYYDNMQQQDAKPKSSHPGFEAAGAAGAGAAAYGLYRHEQDKDKDKSDKHKDIDAPKKGTNPFVAAPLKQEQYDSSKDKKHHERSVEKSPKDDKKRSGGLFGIFGRDKDEKAQDNVDDTRSPTHRKPITTATATTGAAEEVKHHHRPRDDPTATTASEQPMTGHPSQKAEGISGFPDRKSGYPEEKSHGKDSEIAAGLAGVGAGAGAAYGASKLHDRDNATKQAGSGTPSTGHNTVDPSRNTGFMTGPKGTSTTRDDDEYNRLGSGTSSGVRPDESNIVHPTTEGQQGTYAGTGRDNANSSSGKQMISGNNPTTTGHGKGTYNVLSSGTPSGVQLGDESSTTSGAGGTTSRSAKASHIPTATAGLAGAGLGAGAAAASHKHSSTGPYKEGYEYAKDRPLNERESKTAAAAGNADPYDQGYTYSKDLPLDQQEGRSAGYVGAGTAAGAAGLGTMGLMGRNNKITHKCENCGHDNDISRYFQNKSNASSNY